MFGYITLGTNDLKRASAFYDGLLGQIGVTRMTSASALAVWGAKGRTPVLMVTRPFDGASASVGNGSMLAIEAANRQGVDALYALALRLGAGDEGKPGPRGAGGFYAGYFRDPDGHKLNAYCWDKER